MRITGEQIRTVGDLRESLVDCDPTTPVDIAVDGYNEDGDHLGELAMTVDASTHTAQINIRQR